MKWFNNLPKNKRLAFVLPIFVIGMILIGIVWVAGDDFWLIVPGLGLIGFAIGLQADADKYDKEKAEKEHKSIINNYTLADNALEIKTSSQYNKARAINKYIMAYFGKKDVRKITKNNLIDWQTWLFTRTYTRNNTEIQISNNYAHNMRQYLNGFLNWLTYRYDIPNILPSVKPPKKKDAPKTKEILELSEFTQLDEVTAKDILWHTIFNFMFHTGARPGEVQAFAESDYRNGEIEINKTLTRNENGKLCKIGLPKNNKIYSKPIADVLIAKLDKYIEWKRQNNISSKFLFGGDTYIDRHKYERQLRHYMSKTNIPKYITLHCFRRSYVSMLIDMDCSTKTVAEMIGDTEEVVAKNYSYLYTSKKQRTVDKINKFMSGEK